jgi:hypothetical protein
VGATAAGRTLLHAEMRLSIYRPLGVGWIAICLALVGCNSTARLDLSSQAPQAERVRHTVKTEDTVVEFTTTKDSRLDPESLGAVARRRFDGDKVASWIDQALSTLGSTNYSVRTGAEHRPGAGTIIIHPSLLKLYVDSLSTTKTAVVVIQLDFELPGSRRATHTYRGQYAGMNWGSGTGEVTSALNLALSDCLEKIDESLITRTYLRGASGASTIATVRE